MILVEIYNNIIDSDEKIIIRTQSDLSLRDAIPVLKSVLNEDKISFIHVLDTESFEFVKLEVIEKQCIPSYMLDLFDFKSNF